MSASNLTAEPEKKLPVRRVLIGATGSVASIKVPQLAKSIIKQGLERHGVQIEIAIAASNSALHFFRREQLPEEHVTLYTDQDEWSEWKKIGDPVLHIELRKWADICVVAPLDANTMAKVATGFCDNLLTCVLRAWDMTKPRIVCPAMNPMMWEHPITDTQINTLKMLGFRIINPVAKTLACGDIGMGAMAEPEDIAQAVVDEMAGLIAKGKGPSA
ncbi:hypothetical protein GGH91_003038 [Coemansia sp. RSA 2671]|uniref:Uncharacterized protein n=1 Tax=Coemansia linderi TaxID=2663919 RepID=A0ACC1KNQ4_9FUNG|nr:hypothetical protein LPJ60_003842 [Coemansia sp. RSA 2675]KAJ2343932.1 hypothetical protein GGH91_003038 [Coemansia sp. RSA 2671]KAJ2386554.1 hypothetical protein H4S02_003799 [Coemansia sp. RSA 2611]KAJ2400257.1 hypothetical protein GGI10_006251 [Coemansia sp. RSA 2530]KAJ2697135.1 hypothetical protein H4218_004159 [Coemansia sp. IMI 209128]KAJ2792323.1 hypothetical protein GGI18_000497 [Coemansia linderi]